VLTIYRRHKRGCPRRAEAEIRVHVSGDVFVRKGEGKCSCGLWVDGFYKNRELRKSLKTSDWKIAQDKVRGWDAQQSEPAIASEAMAIESACERFLADAQARQLAECTLYKYRLLFKQIGTFARKLGFRYLKELDLPALDQFRTEWKDGPRSSLKKLERLRAFLRHCERRKWTNDNPAVYLKAPKIRNKPTLPFTHAEMIKIFAAFDRYSKRAGVANAQRLKSFVLLLRYSGMRIGDTVKCEADRIVEGKLFLYTQKTGVPVHCVLPDFVVRELEAAPKSSTEHFFWTGKSKLRSAIGKWQRRLQNLFKLAEIRDGHAHRFRDTFAIELLLAGVPLERVSVLLGHQSVRVTERHYSPWVRARQEQLESDLKRAWSQDPVALMIKKGTNQVHVKDRRIN
jgi:integrase/recombinase XerD